MGIVLKLFKLQIDEIYNIFKGKNLKKLAFSLGKYLITMIVLVAAVQMASSKIFYLGFKVNAELIGIVLLITQVIALAFAVGNLISSLFLSKNNELLLSLPASANQIFLSKMLVIYVREVVVNSIYTFPLLYALSTYGGLSLYYKLMLIPLMLILPLLPLSIAALVSIPVTKLLKVLKRHTTITIILIFAIIISILVFYVQALSAIAEFDVGNNQIETVWKANDDIAAFGSKTAIFFWLAQAIIQASKIQYLFLYIGIGAVCFVGATFFIRPFFFKAAMESQEDSSSTKYSREFKKEHPFVSLIKKEFLTVFRSPGYVFQYFIFALLMPVIVLLYDNLLLSMDIVTKTGRMMIDGAHLIVVLMLATLSNIISASAISREGGNFYIIKISPVNYYIQTAAKVVFNALFSVTAVLITCIATIIAGFFTLKSLSIGVIIAATIVTIFMSLAHIALSFDMDLKNPTLNWYDSGDITSVSGNTTKSILYSLAISIIMGMFIISFAASSHSVLPWVLLILFSIGFCIYRFYILGLRVYYQYERLEM